MGTQEAEDEWNLAAEAEWNMAVTVKLLTMAEIARYAKADKNPIQHIDIFVDPADVAAIEQRATELHVFKSMRDVKIRKHLIGACDGISMSPMPSLVVCIPSRPVLVKQCSPIPATEHQTDETSKLERQVRERDGIIRSQASLIAQLRHENKGLSEREWKTGTPLRAPFRVYIAMREQESWCLAHDDRENAAFCFEMDGLRDKIGDVVSARLYDATGVFVDVLERVKLECNKPYRRESAIIDLHTSGDQAPWYRDLEPARAGQLAALLDPYP